MSTTSQNQLISSALLKWISLLISKPIISFEQLSTGDFYLELLSCAKEFKLIKPIKSLSSQPESTLALATKISNIKTIGDSVVRYYQTHLMKDVSQMKISYLQLCMGNCEEAIKLFSLVVGIFVEEGGVMLGKFQEALEKLETDLQYIVKALLDNTKTIGESIVKSNEVTLQQKILTKLEIYEEKIESLELESKDLRIQLEEERQSKQAFEADIKQLKAERTKLIQKAQILQVLNSRLESENSSFILQNQNIQKKLESQKRHYDQILAKNQEKISSYQKEITMVESMKQKIDELKSVNFELKEQLTEQIESSKNEQAKFTMMKENYKILQQNFMKVQKKLSEVELEYQEYRYSCDQTSAIKRKSKVPSSPGYRFSNNSQLSSLKYRMRDRLESELKGELSQYQMINSIITGKASSKEKNRNFMQSNLKNSNFMEGQNLMSSNFDHHNLSNFIINEIGNPNIKDIQDVSEFVEGECKIFKEMEDEEQLDRSIIVDDQVIQQKSQEKISFKEKTSKIKIIDMMTEERANEEQVSLLVQVVSQFYSQNQWLKTELKKYQEFRIQKENRTEEFKKKLAKIREIQPISQVNSNFETLKENMNTMNSNPLNCRI